MRHDRRRLRQRAEHDRCLTDSSSDTDTLLGAEAEEKQGSAQESAVDITLEHHSWECPLCTFVNEDVSAYRCNVCESKRPGSRSKTRKMSQWLSQPVDRTEKKQRHKRNTSMGTRGDTVEAIDSSGSGESDDAAVSTTSTNHEATSSRRSNDRNTCELKTVRSSRELWENVHAPKTVDDLCINKKKVQEISDWLHHNASSRSDARQKRLLFLCGPPGSGKSTAVRCIALQLGLLVKEWSDSSSAGKLRYTRMLRDEFYMPQVSGVDDFSDFVHRSVTYAALPLATSRHMSCVGRKRRLPSNEGVTCNLGRVSVSTGQLILIESWPQSWSSDPSLYEEKLRQIYQSVVNPAGGCQYPVVCIYSDVQGSKIDLEHLSRKFSREVMHSPLTSVININAVTSTQMRKRLKHVATQENCAVQMDDVRKIIDSSGGDMRHALNMLQLLKCPSVNKPESASAPARKKEKREAVSISMKALTPITSSTRDSFFSDFHVVGKLLHGKTSQSKRGNECELKCKAEDVDDDQLLAASTMPLEKVLGLVHENSIAYFSQVEDLSGALELMSFCEMMVAKSCDGVSSSEAFKRSRDIAQAIILRSIAVTNENPTPKMFRPITRPRTYIAKQRMVSRREEVELVTRGDDHEYQYACMGDVFAFEVEPYLKMMDQAGGAIVRPIDGESTRAMDSLSLQDVVDDEIENSDEEW
ncbi:unnamed protein product [Hyaloperonospora brassicae]|uniref:RanBP2-type domain-containing protein n=1 Tax=Hyaloperonospora brassicae TaxID=162125 RepID=A0AAV0UXV8_HYABA|nr:unnamed protein product [Hyaloperonospora brassicae]